MDGFKSSPKMQCFKEGGAVKYKSRHSEKSEMSEDIAQDKKVVKKAFAMHDKQSHEGDKTNLSKLKKGGRMKKEGGCVGRYKDGGKVKKYNMGGMASYDQAMQDPKAKKMMRDASLARTLKANPISETELSSISDSGAAKGLRNYGRMYKQGLGMKPDTAYEYKKGGKVKKYADGGIVDNIKAVGKKLYENVMGTPEQNKAAAEQEKAIAEKDPSSYEAKYRKLTGKKRGGKAC